MLLIENNPRHVPQQCVEILRMLRVMWLFCLSACELLGRSTTSYFKNIYSTLSYSCTLALLFRDLFWRMGTTLMGSSQNSVLVQSLASAKAADKHNISTTGVWPLKFGLGSLSCFTFIPKLLWHFNGDEPDGQALWRSLFGTRMQGVCYLQLNIGIQASL